MKGVIHFRPESDSVIGVLNSATAEAAGRGLCAVLVCGVTKDGLLFSNHHHGNHWAELLAAVANAGHELLKDGGDGG